MGLIGEDELLLTEVCEWEVTKPNLFSVIHCTCKDTEAMEGNKQKRDLHGCISVN